MTKKWLYSVAVGALLIAGEAMGVTVHDVLSNGFFSSEIRETASHLIDTTNYKDFIKKDKTTQDEEGNETLFFAWSTRGRSAVNGVRWKEKVNSINWDSKDEKVNISVEQRKLTVNRPLYREKNLQDTYEETRNIRRFFSTNTYNEVTIAYTNKPRKKDARPIGPFVVDDWFPDEMTTEWYKTCRFFGTEHNAVTNVISDNEAYITGTISQTGHVDEYKGYKANEDSSLLRTYTQHITTDADHVYVEQEITENCQNASKSNSQSTWQTQYTATFKKGRWKGETETISQVSNKQLADWYIKKFSQNYR